MTNDFIMVTVSYTLGMSAKATSKKYNIELDYVKGIYLSFKKGDWIELGKKAFIVFKALDKIPYDECMAVIKIAHKKSDLKRKDLEFLKNVWITKDDR